MEHTKGELEIMPYTQRDGDNIRWVKAVRGKRQAICQTFKPNAEANAKELVRRWNAFEEGGMVDELKVACKIGLDSMQGLLRIGIEMGASNKNKREHNEGIKFVEAAIAKVS